MAWVATIYLTLLAVGSFWRAATRKDLPQAEVAGAAGRGVIIAFIAGWLWFYAPVWA